MNNVEILSSFITKDDLLRVISSLKNQIELEIEASEIKDKALYRQQVFVKLNLIFRRQIVLSEDEAKDFYESNPFFFEERVNLFYELIDMVNNEIKVAYIPDKLTLCAFFRITAETWDNFVSSYSTIKESIRRTFVSLEEFIISMTTTGVEIGQLKPIAFEKMKLKGKFGGSNLEYHQNPKINSATVITMQEAANKESSFIASKYDAFQKLENKVDKTE